MDSVAETASASTEPGGGDDWDGRVGIRRKEKMEPEIQRERIKKRVSGDESAGRESARRQDRICEEIIHPKETPDR
jgi:hypothetical protein